MTESLRIGLLGAGEWGPNVLRAFVESPDCRVTWVCDPDPVRRRWIETHYPGLPVLDSDVDAFAMGETDAIAVCTPSHTHFRLCRAALESGRHVFVEKPLATRFEQAQLLLDLARERQKKLMVGHVFLFHPAIAVIQKRLDQGRLGTPVHFSSSRCHWGPIRPDVDVLWDVLPHDLSLLRSWIPEPPAVVRATGLPLGPGETSDSVLAELRWTSGFSARLQASWLEPSRSRRTTIVGAREALVFQESPDSCTVRRFVPEAEGEASLSSVMGTYRKAFRGVGEPIEIPSSAEPLRLECDAFADWILRDRPQPSGACLGAEVVLILECLSRSLRFGGEPTAVPKLPLWGGTA